MRKLLAWLEDHPITAFCAAMVIFAVGGHFVANWLAERRWDAYCVAARARGAKISIAEIIPPEIPDSENFAALPMFRAIFRSGATNAMDLHVADRQFPGFGKPWQGGDWEKWRVYLQAGGRLKAASDSAPRDVLRALETFRPQMAEWSEWRTRPRCRFPIDYKAGFSAPMAHIEVIRDAAKLFSLRMEAHLAVGEPRAAYADFQDGMQSYRALAKEPGLIAGLVQGASVASLVSSLGAGLRDHHWPDSELKRIATDLDAVHLGLDYQRAMSTERAFNNSIYDLILDVAPTKRGKTLANISGQGVAEWPFILIPRRVFRDNQLRSNEEMDRVLSIVKTHGESFSLNLTIPRRFEPSNDFGKYYYFLHGLVTSMYDDAADRFARQETRLRQARLACALERFYIAKGTFPETLDALVPDYIAAAPPDLYSDKPMIYRKKDGGSFVLYSVGPNRVDDLGIINPRLYDHQQPDIVWYFAPASVP